MLTLLEESIQNPLESITTRGMFIKNTKHSSILYRDIFENSIHKIYFRNPSLQTLIIQTANAREVILPYVYRSMRADCFLGIHFNFDKGIVADIPPNGPDLANNIYNIFYKKYLFCF